MTVAAWPAAAPPANPVAQQAGLVIHRGHAAKTADRRRKPSVAAPGAGV